MKHFPAPPSSRLSLADEALGKQFDRLVGRVSGAVFLVIGLLLSLCAVKALLSAAVNAGAQRSSMLGAATFFALPAALLLHAGFRLISQRPNKFKSLFRPLIWYLLGCIFAFFAFTFIALIYIEHNPKPFDSIGAVIASALLALLCYGAGSSAARRARPNPSLQRTASPPLN